MLIGILHTDLDGHIGGGQTFFRSLIEKSPHEFVFPTSKPDGRRIGRITAVPVGRRWRECRDALDLSKIAVPGTRKTLKRRENEILELFDVLESFGDRKLDILEIPDYYPYAAFVPAIARCLGLLVGKFVLSMHGTLSAVLADHWVRFDGDIDLLRHFEDLLFKVVDDRYGIGPRNVETFARRLGRPAFHVDVGTIFDLDKKPMTSKDRPAQAASAPDILFVGRHEKCKGPDILIDLCSKLPKHSYGQIRIIGPSVELQSTSSTVILNKMADTRHLDIRYEVLKRPDLVTLLSSGHAVAVFPSRVDTFNLAALEALLNGCPCAISRNCGIVDYLAKAYPGIPYLMLNGDAPRDRLELEDLLAHYDEARRDLRDYLARTDRTSFGTSIEAVHAAPSSKDEKARSTVERMMEEILAQLGGKSGETALRARLGLKTRLAAVLFRPQRPYRSSLAASAARPAAADHLFAPLQKSEMQQRPAAKSGSRLASLPLPRFARKQSNPLFDGAWYLDEYPDVREAGLDPYAHYRAFGASEKRRPNRVFDGAWYLSNYPDVAQRADPLDHYVSHGALEGRWPNATFDPARYRSLHPEIGKTNPVLHYLRSDEPTPLEFAPHKRNCLEIDQALRMFDVSVELGEDIDAFDRSPNFNEKAIADGRDVLAGLNRHNFFGDRITAYRFAAEIERACGNEVLCATYHLRALRLGGKPDAERAAMVADLLQKNGYPREAEVVLLLHGGAEPEHVARYLENQRERCMTWSGTTPAEIVERRTNATPRISIIVSVYNGMQQIGNFLTSLQGMPEGAWSETELVLVDSNSTDGTGTWIKTELDARTVLPAWLDTVYVRSVERETIQKAWNRGIAAARGRYFSFMGVDEFNRPDGYAKLADFLDANLSVDWVVSDAAMQNVDMKGAFIDDVMRYRRKIVSKNDHLLDCCYVSYVGCLYRASIHDRFGYYDESFRAAGDTEFKNRILRDVQIAPMEDCIGFFTNYPVERVTESPAAEIEDLRAWYLHRSLGGLIYHLGNTSADDLLELFIRTLGYKKSYMEMECTDLELASNLAQLIKLRFPGRYDELKPVAQAIENALDAYRMLDEISGDQSDDKAAFVTGCAGRILSAADMLVTSYDVLVYCGKPVPLDFRSDNRSHQHNNMWQSRADTARSARSKSSAQQSKSPQREKAVARPAASNGIKASARPKTAISAEKRPTLKVE